MFMLLVSIQLQKCHYKSNRCSIFHDSFVWRTETNQWGRVNDDTLRIWSVVTGEMRPSRLNRLCLMMFSKPETLHPQAGSLHWSWHSYRWGGRGWSSPHPPLLNNTRRKMLEHYCVWQTEQKHTRKLRTICLFHKPHVSQSATDVTKMSLHNLC